LKTAVEFCFDSVYYTREGEVSVNLRRFVEFISMKQGAKRGERNKGGRHKDISKRNKDIVRIKNEKLRNERKNNGLKYLYIDIMR